VSLGDQRVDPADGYALEKRHGHIQGGVVLIRFIIFYMPRRRGGGYGVAVAFVR
jgi:hypothetical protein